MNATLKDNRDGHPRSRTSEGCKECNAIGNRYMSDDTGIQNRIIEYVQKFVRTASGNALYHATDEEIDMVYRHLSGIANIPNERGPFDGGISWGLDTIQPSKYPVDLVIHKASLCNKTEISWPLNRQFAVCLTHDVDNVSTTGSFRRVGRRIDKLLFREGKKADALVQIVGGIYRFISSPFVGDRLANLDRWLDIEESYCIKSTWFVLPEVYSRYHVYDGDYTYSDSVLFRGNKRSVAELVRTISESGCEVGLHGSYFSYNSKLMLEDQKRRLEEVVGKSIYSIRQHYLRYDIRSTPKAHYLAGFLSDTTRGYNTKIGVPAMTVFPYRTWDLIDNQQLPLLEIPMCIMDGPLLKGAKRADLRRFIERVLPYIEHAQKMGGCIVLNWHANNMCHDIYMDAYKILLDEFYKRNAWFCTINELRDEWEKREKRVVGDRRE